MGLIIQKERWKTNISSMVMLHGESAMGRGFTPYISTLLIKATQSTRMLKTDPDVTPINQADSNCYRKGNSHNRYGQSVWENKGWEPHACMQELYQDSSHRKHDYGTAGVHKRRSVWVPEGYCVDNQRRPLSESERQLNPLTFSANHNWTQWKILVEI